MTKSTERQALGHSLSRRNALIALASTFAAAACGGGSSTTSSESPQADGPPAIAPPARLTLNGSQMLLPGGTPTILRGMNEGTWGEMRDHDASDLAGNGARVVRLLIRWWGLYGGTDVDSRSYDPNAKGHFDGNHVDRLLQEIQWCLDAKLWVVVAIDSNCGQYGQQSTEMESYCDNSNFWTDLNQRQLFKEAWVYLAGLLKSYPNVAFYEVLPEPLQNSKASDGPSVAQFYQEIMTAIEDGTGDKRTPFLIGGPNAYDITLCDSVYLSDPRWKNRVVYTGNLFIHPNGTQQQNLDTIDKRIGALTSMRSNRNVPIFVQQYGVRTGDDPNEFYLDYGLNKLNSLGVGYTGWQWRQNTTNPDEYAVVLTDPKTNKDVVKNDVLSVYSKYWKA